MYVWLIVKWTWLSWLVLCFSYIPTSIHLSPTCIYLPRYKNNLESFQTDHLGGAGTGVMDIEELVTMGRTKLVGR